MKESTVGTSGPKEGYFIKLDVRGGNEKVREEGR
jgi:hypothetical protein